MASGVAATAVRGPERRDWIALGVICVASIVISLDQTALNVALPTLVRELHPSSAELQWIADGYTLTNAVLLLLGGVLGDRFGRRRIFLFGLTIFGAGSLGGALVHTTGALIAVRVVMGLGAALIMPGTMAIIASTFAPERRAHAIAIWAGVNGIGTAAGPVIGGVLLQHFWWGSIFLINVPLVLGAVVVGVRAMTESKADVKPRLDPLAVVLSAGGMALLTYGAIDAPTHGWLSGTVLGTIAGGVVVLVAFGKWDTRDDRPLLDLSLFRNRTFSGALGAISAMFFALFGVQYLMSQYLQFVQGDGPLGVGVRFLPIALTTIAGSFLSTVLVKRFGLWPMLLAGMAILATAQAIVYTSVTATSSYLPLGIAFSLVGLGLGLAIAPASTAIVSSLPMAKVGAGSGVRSAVQLLGGSFGVAVIGSIAATRYRSRVQDAFSGPLAQLPAPARAPVHDQIGAASAVADRLPAGLAGVTRRVAGDAYVNGIHWAAATGTIVLLVAMATAARFSTRTAALETTALEDSGGEPISRPTPS
ncbi:MAG TPA: MFS transporter [Mycobacteriales bacterium]|nr:MFS transporter [Mycobacteriales bacterium]